MSRVPNVVVVGSCMLDQITRAVKLPQAGETATGTSYATGFGGKGANQAVMAARLGARVSMVARLGSDPVGQQTLDNFRAQQIDTRHVGIADNQTSGIAPIWVDETTGQNRIIVVPGANALLSASDVDAAAQAIERAHVVVCQLETPVDATRRAFAIARRAGAVTLLNPAPAAPVPDDVLALTTYLVPNETELAALSGDDVRTIDDAHAAATQLLPRGIDRVLVTLGAQGCLLVTASGATHVTAPAVRAIDTTGAGDAFIGAFGYFLGAGVPELDAMRRACVVASTSVQAHGTQSSYPSAAQLPASLFDLDDA
jgi:ribokinase